MSVIEVEHIVQWLVRHNTLDLLDHKSTITALGSSRKDVKHLA